MNRDFAEMLSALSDAGADFLIVGAHALAAHGLPRATGGLDIWVRPSLDNARRVLDALRTFQVPLHDLSEDDLARPGTVFQIGVVPNRIDILTEISGVAFEDAWTRRVSFVVEGQRLPFLGRADLAPTSARRAARRTSPTSRPSTTPKKTRADPRHPAKRVKDSAGISDRGLTHRLRDTIKTTTSEHGIDGRVSEAILAHIPPGIIAPTIGPRCGRSDARRCSGGQTSWPRSLPGRAPARHPPRGPRSRRSITLRRLGDVSRFDSLWI